MPPDSIEAGRIRIEAGGERLKYPVIMLGGPGRFAEHCPGADGCLAVEYSGPGTVSRTWPFHADLIGAALSAHAPLPGSDKTPGVRPLDVLAAYHVAPYPDGDLFVNFTFHDFIYPAMAGSARIGLDGRPRWFNAETGGHHEAVVTAGDTVWSPGLSLVEPPVVLDGIGTWNCDWKFVQLDHVSVLDENGALVDEVSLLDAFLASRWAPALRALPPCDPFHLNAVAFLNEDVSGLDGARPGDLVLSLRNLSAFVIMGRDDRVIKRVFRGTFLFQHSVKHLGGSKFAVFDNRGYWPATEQRYSRVFVVDVANGTERIVFPTKEGAVPAYEDILGRLSISPDRTRILASFSEQGRAVEVRIADGAVLAELNFVHDLGRFGRSASDRPVVQLRGTAIYASEAR